MSENTDDKETDGLHRPSTDSLKMFLEDNATLEEAMQLWVKLENPREMITDE